MQPAQMSSESSVKHVAMLKNTKKARKDHLLSVMTGSNIFGPTDIITMVIDQDSMAEAKVSIRSMGLCAKTDWNCLVHPAPK
jgi:hypothetical protein